MDLYPNEEEEVLLLLERVTEAQRFATMVCRRMATVYAIGHACHS